MKVYEIATLKTVIFGAGKASPGLQEWIDEGRGTLLGAFAPDIGPLNEILLFRSYDNLQDMFAERERTMLSDNPMGCVEHLVDMSFETFRQFDFMPDPEPGAYGKVYEFRNYMAKLPCLGKTQERWRDAVPGRNNYSKVVFAGWGLDGSPRLTQIWPYASHEARTEARAKSVAEGAWPPKNGPDGLTPYMTSTIAMPLPFSPMA